MSDAERINRTAAKAWRRKSAPRGGAILLLDPATMERTSSLRAGYRSVPGENEWLTWLPAEARIAAE